MEEAEVARAKEGPFACVLQVGVKGTLRFVRSLPIALRHAGTGNPDLADFVGRHGGQIVGVGDDDALIQKRRATAHELASAVFVERVFGLPGIGNMLYGALLRRDLPVIVGVVVVITTAILVFNLIVDLLYGVVDPRVRDRPARSRVRRRAPRSPGRTTTSRRRATAPATSLAR